MGQWMNKECPSIAGGDDTGYKCSAVPPLASVHLTALRRGKGFSSRLGTKRGRSGSLISINQVVSPALPAEGYRLGRAVHVPCMLFSPLRPFTRKPIPWLFPLQGAPSTSLLLLLHLYVCWLHFPQQQKSCQIFMQGQLFLSYPQAFYIATAIKLSPCFPCLIAERSFF